ncbi:glutamine amidotransferase [Ampullimonas aquatilis]|uniref:glutamine amidotransferase n=1 Tax=Ampullimonas aquatilis TaxID=1341549 RepID=UPI003C77D411
MKTVLALRHIHFEDLGILEPLLHERGYEINYLNAATDDLNSVDVRQPNLLVVLGGPIGAFDEIRYPFLDQELVLIRQRLEAQQPILGICLGAQLMARGLGASIASMGVKEIGFGPISLTPEGRNSVLAALVDTPVLHWHGDRFELPLGTQLLAGTQVCVNQAFALHEYALGLQFHLEADTNHLEHWLVGHASELAQFDIDPSQLRIQAAQHGPLLMTTAKQVFNLWLDQIEASHSSTISEK